MCIQRVYYQFMYSLGSGAASTMLKKIRRAFLLDTQYFGQLRGESWLICCYNFFVPIQVLVFYFLRCMLAFTCCVCELYFYK